MKSTSSHALAETYGRAASIGVNTVITGVDRNVSSGNIDRDRFKAFVTGCDEDCSALNIKLIVAVYGIVSRIYSQGCPFKTEAVIDVDAVLRRSDRDVSSCNDNRPVRIS